MNDIEKAIQEWIESYEGDNLKKRVLITAYPKIVEFVERARQDERKIIFLEISKKWTALVKKSINVGKMLKALREQDKDSLLNEIWLFTERLWLELFELIMMKKEKRGE